MAELGIGARIRRARQCRGMSQAELARRIGIAANTLNSIELGKTRSASVDVVQRIARALRVKADFFLGFTDEIDPEPASTALVDA